MPKKINTSRTQNKKEKQILTARLIEISLKIEDYIYNHTPISVCEAEQYLREVTTYKTQCGQDERSLQVIEKITRCMKAIILDHQELTPQIVSENNGSSIAGGDDLAGSISPVYSIADEDRTQLTQIAEARPVNVTVANKDVGIIDLCNIDDDDDFIHNETSTANADFAGSRTTVEVDIHRGMSSLSLGDVEAPFITSSDINYSQSILNNFESVEQIQQNEINIVSQRAVACGNVADKEKTGNVMSVGGNATLGSPNKKTTFIIEPNQTSICPNKTVLGNTNKQYKAVQNKEPLKEISNTNCSLTINSNLKDNTISSHTFYPGSINIPESHRKTWYDSNRTCTINDSTHTLKDANQFTQPAQIYEVVNPINQNSANMNVYMPRNTFNASEKENQPINATETSRALINNTVFQKDSATIKKKRCPRKKKTIDEKEIKPKHKRVYRACKNNKQQHTLTNLGKYKRIPIYNENVMNDLSWIENIRFVREIEADENDPKLNLEESFWDNYCLPANWSENEFV